MNLNRGQIKAVAEKVVKVLHENENIGKKYKIKTTGLV